MTKNLDYLNYVAGIDAYGISIFSKPWHSRSVREAQHHATITKFATAKHFDFRYARDEGTGYNGQVFEDIIEQFPIIRPPYDSVTTTNGGKFFAHYETVSSNDESVITATLYPTYVPYASALLTPIMSMKLRIDKYGMFIPNSIEEKMLIDMDDPYVLPIILPLALEGYNSDNPNPQQAAQDMRGYMCGSIGVDLLGFSFCHCKNVDAKDQYLPRPLKRDRERKGLPSLEWKTLIVKPAFRKAETPTEERAAKARKGLLRLHTVRGHYARYGEQWGTKPLFGKYEGLFYIPAHWRGDVENGLIGKDYQVKP